jgi:outer membrane protein W
LIYKIYYTDKSGTAVRKEETYKEQLSLLIDKYAPENIELKKKLFYLKYSQLHIRLLLREIAGTSALPETKSAVVNPNKTLLKAYISAGFLAYRYNADVATNSAPSSNLKGKNLLLSAGIDIVPNKYKNNMFIRFDASFTNTKFKNSSEKIQGTNTKIFQEDNLSQTFLLLTPTVNFYFGKEGSYRIYYGLGLGYNLSLQTNFNKKEIYYISGNLVSMQTTQPYKGVYSNLHVGGNIGVRVKESLFLNLTVNVLPDLPFAITFTSLSLGYSF